MLDDPRYAALDAAILAHRENPTPETQAALDAATKARVTAFMREETADFQRRTH